MAEAEYTGRTVEIIPDYNNLFTMFLNDFEMQNNGLKSSDTETFGLYHGILASLNIAVQSIGSTENLEIFRNQLSQTVAENSEILNAKRQADEEVDNDCNCDYPNTLGGHHPYCNSFEG